jgi:hypothetical protein
MGEVEPKPYGAVPSRNLADRTAACVRLVASFLALPGQVERLVGVLPGLPAASRQTTDPAERSPRFAITPSPCLGVQYLVLLALTRFYTVQSQPELLLFRLAQLSKVARAQRDTA